MPRRRYTPVQVPRSWAARRTQTVVRSHWHGEKFYAMHWGYKMDNQQGGGNAGCPSRGRGRLCVDRICRERVNERAGAQ